MDAGQHTPVLVKELGELFFSVPERPILVDATLGLGGHSEVFLRKRGAGARVVGLEADLGALLVAKERLRPWQSQVELVRANFGRLREVLVGLSVGPVSLVLFDLGIGSHQLADDERGFSFTSVAPLTMRFGDQVGLPPSQLPALNQLENRLGYLPDVSDILQYLSSRDIAEILRVFGEERHASRISRAVASQKLESSHELAEAVSRAVPGLYRRGRIHPATRTFQALRLAVNRELEVLEATLPQAFEALQSEGLLAVISFHSLEDRIVKRFIAQLAKPCLCPDEVPQCVCERRPRMERLTKKPIVASAEEVADNPRARSAKLRIAKKL